MRVLFSSALNTPHYKHSKCDDDDDDDELVVTRRDQWGVCWLDTPTCLLL